MFALGAIQSTKFLLTALTVAATLAPMVSFGLQQTQDELPERIPQEWIDLPEAPFVARVIDGTVKLVSVTSGYVNGVSTGCVIEKDGRVVVVKSLLGVYEFHGSYGPKASVDNLLGLLGHKPFLGGRELTERCPSGTNAALISAGEWKADGTPWPR